MKLSRIFLGTGLFLAAGILLCLLALQTLPTIELDPIDVNDIVRSAGENWDTLAFGSKNPLPAPKGIDYAILDADGALRAATRRDITATLAEAIRHRDTTVCITENDRLLGYAIFYNNTEQFAGIQRRLFWKLMGLFLLPAVLCGAYTIYLNRRIFRPFAKLQAFASNVARGDLDTPLEMDRGNLFGAFTESFDLMRSELAKARRNEYLANQSKKELVASLSHDIKTPVASIKAVSEVMLATTEEEHTSRQLSTIVEKADQIDLLITDLFHATLEELQELKVNPVELVSTELPSMLAKADYNGLLTCRPIPECIIIADPLRLQQVFDNIVNNAYKYAGRDLPLQAYGHLTAEGDALLIGIDDCGPGVPDEELPLLTNKFYRGRNTEGVSGSGLGLYISQYFLTQCGGGLTCQNRANGFTVTVRLQLA